MRHDYGVPLRFLSITPTRDNDAAPGNRLADKHSRLFCGRTLDEWTMIQLWSSKYLGKAVFVCETVAHRKRLQPLADEYGVELMVRPRDMLHPLNDTGGVPIYWAAKRALDQEYYTLVTTPFVVSPCRGPGFFDRMCDIYAEKVGNPDYFLSQAWVMGAFRTDTAYYELDERDVGRQVSTVLANANPRARLTHAQHWMGASWWWFAHAEAGAGRVDLSVSPVMFDIEAWEDIHIDTLDQWEAAEYWFTKKIGSKEPYESYRNSWTWKETGTANA